MEFMKTKKWNSIHKIFQKFIEYFTGKNFDLVSLPRISAVDCFLYPELHEESVMVITAHRVLHRIYFSAGLNNFSFSVYLNLNFEKMQKNLVHILNLAKYREKALKNLIRYSEKVNISFSTNEKTKLALFTKLTKNHILEKILNNFKKLVRSNQLNLNRFNLSFFLHSILKKNVSKKVKISRNKYLYINGFLEWKKIYFFLELPKFYRQLRIKLLKKKKLILSNNIKDNAFIVCSVCKKTYSFCLLIIDFILILKKVYQTFASFVLKKNKKMISLRSIGKSLISIIEQLSFRRGEYESFVKISKTRKSKKFKKFRFILKIIHLKALIIFSVQAFIRFRPFSIN